MGSQDARAAFNEAVAEAEELRQKAEEAEAGAEGGEPPHGPRAAYNEALARAEGLRAAAEGQAYEEPPAEPAEELAAE